MARSALSLASSLADSRLPSLSLKTSQGPACSREPVAAPRCGARTTSFRALGISEAPVPTRYEYALPVPSDIACALELDDRFGKLVLGLVDGTVAAIAERRQIYQVLTTDRRDFSEIRVGARPTRALELLP